MGLVLESYFECLGPDNHQPQYPIYLVPDIRNVSMGPVPESYFECLGPDNHQPQCPIYLVPDIRKVSMGPVPTFIIDVWDQSQSQLLTSGTGPRETFFMPGTR